MAKSEEKTKLSLATVGRKEDITYETAKILSATRFQYKDKEKDALIVKDSVKFIAIIGGEQMSFIAPFNSIRRMPNSFIGGVEASIGTEIREHKGENKLFIRSVEFAKESTTNDNSASKAEALADL